VSGSLAARELLSVVRQGLETAGKADHCFPQHFSPSVRSTTGSDRARDAEGAGKMPSVAFPQPSNATIVVVLLVALLVIATGSVVGRRIRESILALKPGRLKANEEMHQMWNRALAAKRCTHGGSVTQAEASQRQATKTCTISCKQCRRIPSLA